MKAIFKNAWPYQEDKLNLPVKDLESALPFYQAKLNFKVDSRKDLPYKSALLSRDQIQIGLAENEGDPTQDGCFFEVDDVEKALEELKSNGLDKEKSDLKLQNNGQTSWKVFFIVAPDGLCYCIGQKQN